MSNCNKWKIHLAHLQINIQLLSELGLDLAALVKQKINGETARDKLFLVRKSIITDPGINVPGINFKDNTSFRPRGRYIIRIKGAKAAEGVLNQVIIITENTERNG